MLVIPQLLVKYDVEQILDPVMEDEPWNWWKEGLRKDMLNMSGPCIKHKVLTHNGHFCGDNIHFAVWIYPF